MMHVFSYDACISTTSKRNLRMLTIQGLLFHSMISRESAKVLLCNLVLLVSFFFYININCMLLSVKINYMHLRKKRLLQQT